MTPDLDLADVVAVRRHLHRTPELGFCEVLTAAFVVERLRGIVDELRYGDEVIDTGLVRGAPDAAAYRAAADRARAAGVDPRLVDALAGGRTGVVATIRGDRPGRTVGIRVDMDALPIVESSDAAHAPAVLGFRSEHEGVMHACAHDGHVAIGLAVAAALRERDFAGELRLIFQPAEEGLRGASAIRPEATDGVDLMLGLHLGMGQPTGVVGASVDGLMASQKMAVTLRGSSAHAALAPEQGRNVILAAATATLGLHALTQHGGGMVRVNVGRIDAGSATNVVAEHGTLLYEVRSDRTEVLDDVVERAGRVIDGVALAFGVGAESRDTGGAPGLACDASAIAQVLAAAREVDGVTEARPSVPMLASEDVALLIGRVQQRGGIGTLIIVGASSPAAHHTSSFDIDERSLGIGAALLLGIVRSQA